MGNSQCSGDLSGKEEQRAKHRFKQVTGKDQPYLTREKFNDLLGHSPCAEGLFKFVDADGDGTVSFKEIRQEINAFRSMKSRDSKLQVLYNFYDSNHDGKLSHSEVADAMRVACGQVLSHTQLEQLMKSVGSNNGSLSLPWMTRVEICYFVSGNKLVSSTMETFDIDKDGFLNFAEFCNLMHNSGLELS